MGHGIEDRIPVGRECAKFGLVEVGRDNSAVASLSSTLTLVKSGSCFNLHRCSTAGTSLSSFDSLPVDQVIYCGTYNVTECVLSILSCPPNGGIAQNRCLGTIQRNRRKKIICSLDDRGCSSVERCCNDGAGGTECQRSCPLLSCGRFAQINNLGDRCRWKSRVDENGCMKCPKIECDLECEIGNFSCCCPPSPSFFPLYTLPSLGSRVLQKCNTCQCLNDGRLACTEKACFENTNCIDSEGSIANSMFPIEEPCVICNCGSDGEWECSQFCESGKVVFLVKKVTGLTMAQIRILVKSWAQSVGGTATIFHVYQNDDGSFTFFVSLLNFKKRDAGTDLTEYLTSSEGVSIQSVQTLRSTSPPPPPPSSSSTSASVAIAISVVIVVLVLVAIVVLIIIVVRQKKHKHQQQGDDDEFGGIEFEDKHSHIRLEPGSP